MKLEEFVVEEAVITEIGDETKEGVIRKMVASLKSAGKISADDEEGIVNAILKREELGSTGIGKGIAVPHTKHPSVDKLVSTVAIASDGIDFASLDGEDVHILFLLISPPDQPGDHLRALETVSRHLRNESFCNFLKQAKTSSEVMELLKEADENQLA